MGGAGGDVATVAAEVTVLNLIGTVVMRNVHRVVVVLVEETMKGIIVTLIGGGIEAAVLDVEGEEVEALGPGGGGIGVRSGKVVLKEELK